MPETVYHISLKYLGKKPLLEPRVPACASKGEIDTPRICVARTVTGCYLALKQEIDWRGAPPFHLYRAVVEKSVKAHKSVPDRDWTGERWLLEPTRFEYIGKMPRLKFEGMSHLHSSAYKTRVMREWIEGTAGILKYRYSTK